MAEGEIFSRFESEIEYVVVGARRVSDLDRGIHMALSSDGKALLEGLNSRVDNSSDINDMQELLDLIIPSLEEKLPGYPEVNQLKRKIEAKIEDLK